jgi:hypothetical protein
VVFVCVLGSVGWGGWVVCALAPDMHKNAGSQAALRKTTCGECSARNIKDFKKYACPCVDIQPMPWPDHDQFCRSSMCRHTENDCHPPCPADTCCPYRHNGDNPFVAPNHSALMKYDCAVCLAHCVSCLRALKIVRRSYCCVQTYAAISF